MSYHSYELLSILQNLQTEWTVVLPWASVVVVSVQYGCMDSLVTDALGAGMVTSRDLECESTCDQQYIYRSWSIPLKILSTILSTIFKLILLFEQYSMILFLKTSLRAGSNWNTTLYSFKVGSYTESNGCRNPGSNLSREFSQELINTWG